MLKQLLTTVLALSIFLMGPNGLLAQGVAFQMTNDVPVTENGVLLRNAWAGGINSGQFQKLDVNQDGLEDLVVFEKSTGRLTVFLATFLSTGVEYVYAPGMERQFPTIKDYLVIRDYNCDGKKDIFTGVVAGFTAYKNTTAAGAALSWVNISNNSTINYYDPVSQASYNLNISGADYPSFEDVDGDGDIDVLAFAFNFGATVEYFKNMSVENHQGSCEFIELVQTTLCFGQFSESANCSNPYTFNIACRDGAKDTLVNKTLHAGSTVTYEDINGDGSRDFLIGDIGCPNLYMLPNKGGSATPVFDTVLTAFPTNTVPAFFDKFPVAFVEDFNFDGLKDIIVSPNVISNEGSVDFLSSAWYYTNNGTPSNPDYQYVRSNFLQQGMIEVGESAHPALVDYDADGDLDLFVGNREKFQPNLTLSASISRYENVGTNMIPAFVLADADFLGFASLGKENIRPYFFDFDTDGKVDMIFTMTDTGYTSLNYISNTASSATSNLVLTGPSQQISLSGQGNITLGDLDSFAFGDLDSDGDIDMLLGHVSGNLSYYKKTGSVLAKVSDTTAGIGISIFAEKQLLSPVLMDFNANGTLDLGVNTLDGKIRIYEDIRSNLTGSPSFTEQILTGPSGMVSTRLNGRTTLAAGDLNGDGRPEILVGSQAGGINFLSSQVATGLDDDGQFARASLKLFPNPASSLVTLASETGGMVAVFDITGRQVLNQQLMKPGTTVQLDIAGLEAGVYLVNLRLKNGSQVAKRLLIQ